MAVEIPRDLADPEQGVTLRNGASARVRAIRPDDEPRLMALCRRLSPRTVYQRFFSPAPSPGTSSSGQSWRGNGVLPRIRVETERFVHAVGILGGYVVADRPAAVARAAFGPLLPHQELSLQLPPAPPSVPA